MRSDSGLSARQRVERVRIALLIDVANRLRVGSAAFIDAREIPAGRCRIGGRRRLKRVRELQGISLKELVKAARIPPSYHTEIHKGMRLAEHVRII